MEAIAGCNNGQLLFLSICPTRNVKLEKEGRRKHF
jgi:hypothetical protein